MKTIRIEEECKTCRGTGIYVGCCERDGVGVVCNRCNGTGKYILEHNYEDFIERKKRDNVKMVLKNNAHCICVDMQICEEYGAITYEDWLSGKDFNKNTGIRQHVCPRWYNQSNNIDSKMNWKKCDDALGLSFPKCKHFEKKEECWKQWDEEGFEK